MASGLYDKGKLGMMDKLIDLDTDDIRVRAVCDEDYTFNAATHTTMSDVTKYIGSTDYALTGEDITTTEGTFDATDATPAFTALALNEADDIDGLVIYHFITDDAGSTPIAHIDLTTPVTPNGGDINITWNGSGIFSI